jgi:regulator of protease activity HflC (stomatin/prohibitin superfamily)
MGSTPFSQWADAGVKTLYRPTGCPNRALFLADRCWRIGRSAGTGQEILTRDKVALRLNLSATWRCTDVQKAYMQLAKPAEHLYRELQFGLRAAVGTRTLDELVENKTVIDQVVTAQLNTAKVMEDNSVALRLKEIETLERAAERIDKISVFGGPDQVLNGLVELR